MSRNRPDACPSTLQLHDAADGPLARIRLPGGRLSPAQLEALALAAADVASGSLELTSRGNVQLRAVTDADELRTRLSDVGLLPSSTHERVRNIVASPLSGRVGGVGDIESLIGGLDAALQAEPVLADLPGRVLFSLDDGRGDVSGLGADIGLHAVAPDDFALVLAGVDSGARVSRADAVDVMAHAAKEFVALRDTEWRLREIENGAQSVLAALCREPTDTPIEFSPAMPPVGWIDQDDGGVTLGAAVKFGSLDARTAQFLAAVERPVVFTPWRTVVLSDLDEWTAEQVVRVLAPMGLIFDADSPWLTVSACAGRPGCAKALADVRADATAAVENGELPVIGRQHWAGCERRCGRPGGEAVDVVSTGDGYRIT
ncbi:precorrin-3B synthase [Skermania sp. ID1734]|uniref:precorrin-3B synthase n=1 Tax=Skermania sp. ID1734 TaxID=2597516 RepID=UPI00117EDE0B|nr:precorrin-3B synthase [Skermania sp. ID1734]TSE01629.1 precorrin-3B synthase [Skermania sp. ID1734]